MNEMQSSFLKAIPFGTMLFAGACSAAQPTGEPSASISDKKVGEEIEFCDDCPVFVRVPDAPGSMRPIRYVSKYELTWKNFIAAVEDGACENPSYRKTTPKIPDVALDRLKVNWPIGIDREKDIDCYIEWLNGKSQLFAAIPSEVEWEWFARAGVKTKYPWGDKFIPGKSATNISFSGREESLVALSSDKRRVARIFGVEPGRFPPNNWGLHDLMGNMRELTNTKRTAEERDDKDAYTKDLGSGTVKGLSWSRLEENMPDNAYEYEAYPLFKDGVYNVRFGVRFVLLESEQ